MIMIPANTRATPNLGEAAPDDIKAEDGRGEYKQQECAVVALRGEDGGGIQRSGD